MFQCTTRSVRLIDDCSTYMQNYERQATINTTLHNDIHSLDTCAFDNEPRSTCPHTVDVHFAME